MKYENMIRNCAIEMYKAVFASNEEAKERYWNRVDGMCCGIAWSLALDDEVVWDEIKRETERKVRDRFGDDDIRAWDRWNNFWN